MLQNSGKKPKTLGLTPFRSVDFTQENCGVNAIMLISCRFLGDFGKCLSRNFIALEVVLEGLLVSGHFWATSS